MAPQANPLCGNESYMDPLVIIFSKEKCVLDIKSHLKPCFFTYFAGHFHIFPEITCFILSRLGINYLCASLEQGCYIFKIWLLHFPNIQYLLFHHKMSPGGDGDGGGGGRISHLPFPIPPAQEKVYP